MRANGVTVSFDCGDSRLETASWGVNERLALSIQKYVVSE